MAATQYSNERAIQRRELKSLGLQDTQRSWSNYVGNKPIESWVGEQPVSSEARGYADSPRWGPNAKKSGGGGAFDSGAVAARMGYSGTNQSQIMGYAGSPLSFTPFGLLNNYTPNPIFKSPFERNEISSLTGVGGIPMFPFAGY